MLYDIRPNIKGVWLLYFTFFANISQYLSISVMPSSTLSSYITAVCTEFWFAFVFSEWPNDVNLFSI